MLGADTTALVQEARDRHRLSHTATAALGRALTGAILLGQVVDKHPRSRLTLKISGDGPLGGLVAESSNDGSVRGYTRHPEAELPLRPSDGKLDVGRLVGRGDLTVTRLLSESEPYTSSTLLVSGEIAEDLAFFLTKSEQIPSALMLGVYLEGGRVLQAGGLLLQSLPGASQETLRAAEHHLSQLGSITSQLRQRSILEIMELACGDLNLAISGQALPLHFRCRCSLERATGALTYFGADELASMIAEGGQEVVCHWCNTHYQVSPESIQRLAQERVDGGQGRWTENGPKS